MANPEIIVADGLSLTLPVFEARRRGLRRHLLQTMIGGKVRYRDDGRTEVEALRDISFRLVAGDRVALLGHNGSGKTTLLQTCAGLYSPTGGSISVSGSIATLFALVDIDPDGTVVENIRLAGILHGLSGAELEALIDDVLQFAELGDFSEMPVRILSAGMRLRIGFGVSTALPAEIVLIDEIIGVGDARFVERARQRFDNLIKVARVVVLATHALSLAAEICPLAMLLEHGSLVSFGPFDEVKLAYLASMAGSAS